ncbi:hypothetical protein LMG24076_00714 [Trinickia soli]|nr:hypothetical protein LMG24076_00714 [Trinickia soli]
MARRVNRTHTEAADLKQLTIGEQFVEWLLVARAIEPHVEQLAEDLLDFDYLGADCDSSAGLLLQVGRGREVIGMNMRLEQPGYPGSKFANPGNQLVGVCRAGATGLWIEIQHAVDQSAVACVRVHDQIADGEGSGSKKPSMTMGPVLFIMFP